MRPHPWISVTAMVALLDGSGLRRTHVRANGIEFEALEVGEGPLALCLHGFPDTAGTWRHLLPELAAAGFRGVAPFMRGYAPSGLARDGDYRLAAMVADANALHEALGGDGEAVLIGHDWGAEAAYGAAALAPDRWRRLVSLAIPPRALDARLYRDYDQLQRFFYLFFMRTPEADEVVAADGMAFLDRLWADWSPGYDAGEELAAVKRSFADPANLGAAIQYYRAAGPEDVADEDPLVAESRALLEVAPQPTLYLHGERDGCIGVEFAAEAAPFLGPGSVIDTIAGAGHFPQLEQPAAVNARILAFLSA
jgi:pimeloyl-ACP methyl ester carboxylesterase